MSIFNWLRGGKARAPLTAATPSRAERGTSAVSYLGSLVRIASKDFTGHFTRSPNGRFLLAWRDANDEGTHGGARLVGHGRFILMEDDLVIAEGRAERPNDGKVADNGVFILNDWLFYRAGLEGVFLAFRKDGSRILSRRFEANLYNNGLSADGRIAVCQTANAPGSADGSKLTVFDLNHGQEIASFVPESGWAREYVFPEEGQGVQLKYEDDAAFGYAFDGTFIDRPRWAAAGLAKGDVYFIQRLIHDAGEDVSSADAEAFVRGLTTALKQQRDDTRTRALVLKLRGTCHDRLDAPAAALADYEAALALEPKIGVKRRADALRRNMAGG